jgi:hypothetical protein
MLNRAPIRFATKVTLFVLSVFAVCAAQQPVADTPGQPASGSSTGADIQAIVQRMTDAQVENHERVRAYTVVRQYTLKSGNNGNSDSQVVAEVSYLPPGKKEYEIREASGSGRGEKVVRRVLDHETEMSSAWNQTAVTPSNYAFQFVGREQSKDCNCFVLAITPKRDSKDLVKGKVWVDPDSFLIRRMEGELVKSPSWWVKHVNVTLFFNEVRGMWLQTAANADAEVRLLGHHVLESRDLNYRTSDTVAKSVPRHEQEMAARTGARNNFSVTRRRTSPIPVLGTGVVMGPR